MYDMNLDTFGNELELNQEKVDLKQLPFVKSGKFNCYIASSFKNVNKNTGAERINATFVVVNDDNKPIGKFTNSYDLNPSSKFFMELRKLAFLTNNKTLEENNFVSQNGDEYTNFPSLENKPLIAIVWRKPTDYQGTNGAIPNYSVYGLFNTEELSCREIVKKQTDPKDIKVSFQFLKDKIEKDGGELQNLNELKPIKNENENENNSKQITVDTTNFEDEDVPF